jgi:flagellin
MENKYDAKTFIITLKRGDKMNIRTNITSNIARESARQIQENMFKSMKVLSSGKRINSAKDDVSGLAVSNRLQAQSKGIEYAKRNAEEGISLMRSIDGVLSTTVDLLQKMLQLSHQSLNGVISVGDKQGLQSEYTELGNEFWKQMGSFQYNGQKLFNGSSPSITFHVGEKATDKISFNLEDLQWVGDNPIVADSHLMGYEDWEGYSDENNVISLKLAIQQITDFRSKAGSMQNRLTVISGNLDQLKMNTDISNSRIMDADYAKETSELFKNKILFESSISILSKAAHQPENIIQLLRR